MKPKPKKKRAETSMLQKAQRLTEQGETQVWLLASPAEAASIAAGIVPLDIQAQARSAMRYIEMGGV